MNNKLIIYCNNNSERLGYVLNWLFKEQLQLNYTIVTDDSDLKPTDTVITYGKYFEPAVSIPDNGLLWQHGICEQQIKTGEWNNIPTLFATDNSTIPFDIFSAIFYLLSRYEEYLEYKSDEHGRYPATSSILYKYDLLERPIIDEWVNALRKLLAEKLNLKIHNPRFHSLPSYDIDIAYSYRHKGLKRTTGAYIKDLFYGNTQNFVERVKVKSGTEQDPYDSFERIQSLHAEGKDRPIYFILTALETTAFDKNISPQHPAMQMLIKFLSENGTIGLHPSYFSDVNADTFLKEKAILEKIAGVTTIKLSRQHYIRMKLPGTYTRLLSFGIEHDYSMGYSTHLGFRAGTGQSFLWYNLIEEKSTALHIYPFCFMDTTAHFEMSLNVDEAFERLDNMANLLQSCSSTLTTVFHNFSLGTDKEWTGWYNRYKLFLNKHPGSYTN